VHPRMDSEVQSQARRNSALTSPVQKEDMRAPLMPAPYRRRSGV